MKSKLLILLSIAIASFCSCTKNGDKPAGSINNEPVKRPFGNPLGIAVTKTIGEAGGTLEMPGGNIKLVVPQGAVTTPVNFSLQEVQNTLPGSRAQSFRLLPENVDFKSPVTIIYSYEELDMEGTAPGLMYLAYQDKDGYYNIAHKTVLDEDTKILSVQTSHFSDWTIVELLKVTADKTEMQPNETANLKLQWYLGSLLAPLTTDYPIGDLQDYNGRNASKVSWSLAAGQGSIQPSGIKCGYKAPGEIPATNPALVSVSVPISFYNNARPGVAILTTPITTIADEYFIYTLDGVPHVNGGSGCTSPTCIEMEADNFYVSAEMKSGQHILVRLLGESFGTRSYPFGLEDDQAYIHVNMGDEFDWVSSRFPCEKCDEAHSSGSVKLTRYGNVGDYVEGEFTAEIWYSIGYNPPRKSITGKFRVKRRL
ncbi:hypothetical protein [Flavihumibacter solisilvae]|uniref:ZU5 domain-containing protein n=1 Tax=Flavihumibacter solisilvae TaxID=1349421 RepID=A0A0C1LGA9_9BACT|nr:hypothetical protein [Flavihumibacter solisilvae]KIC94388.1 hypothetical protein OI18_12275 [Flavihumibacter solisilvae]